MIWPCLWKKGTHLLWASVQLKCLAKGDIPSSLSLVTSVHQVTRHCDTFLTWSLFGWNHNTFSTHLAMSPIELNTILKFASKTLITQYSRLDKLGGGKSRVGKRGLLLKTDTPFALTMIYSHTPRLLLFLHPLSLSPSRCQRINLRAWARLLAYVAVHSSRSTCRLSLHSNNTIFKIICRT